MATAATLPSSPRQMPYHPKSSYPLIVDHVLSCPGSYEIPLRTMYALNCAPRPQHRPGSQSPARAGSSSSSSSSSPVSAQCFWPEHSAAHAFHESLMHQIAQLPSQHTSLPPSFVTSFVRRCFPPELVLVDFPQALTGLDYLKDLENRRRRDVAAAIERVNIDKATLAPDNDAFLRHNPELQHWLDAIEAKERKVEALYTQLYVAIRRWVLLNEMCLQPFNKHNCIAMLNTLYPPVVSINPTSKLTPAVLKKQRDGFFQYITAVDKSGTAILTNLRLQGRADGEDSGWPCVVRIIAAYLQLANSIIRECSEAAMPSSPSALSSRSNSSSKQRRKVDSGVSFDSHSESTRPSTADSAGRQPPSPSKASHAAAAAATAAPRPRTPATQKSGGTTLEKIARELKRMGISKTDATEMVPPTPMFAEKPSVKNLRRMRSMGTITISSRASPEPAFELDDRARQRLREAELPRRAVPDWR